MLAANITKCSSYKHQTDVIIALALDELQTLASLDC